MSARRIVGLKYEPAEGPPQLVLKASGDLVEGVLRERMHLPHAATVIRNDALLEQLYRLPVDGHIGPELFHAVAVLLAHVLSVDAKLKGESNAA